jgi:hypothetical protein
MISLVPTTGRPSDLHESRARTLAAMARLSGHVIEIDALPDGGRPDVLLVRPTDCSVFIGDAKATETPGNSETALRLSHYAGAIALIVAARDRCGWLRLLLDTCAPLSNGGRVEAHVDLLDPTARSFGRGLVEVGYRCWRP